MPVNREAGVDSCYLSEMTLGERVRSHRERLGWDQQQLAGAVRRLGGTASQSTISDIENDVSKRPRCLAELAEIFGMTEKDLRNGDASPRPIRANVRTRQQGVDNQSAELDITTRDKIVTFRGRLLSDSRAGGWVIYPDRTAGAVELGPDPGQAPRVFRAEVLDADNSPVYDPRDVLFCDPDKHALPGNNCVFVGNPSQEGDGGAPAVLARLLSANADEWIVKQYSSGSREMKLPKEKWPFAWVVFRRDQAV
jgi:transcriptional regulator with XRE-family HTH domain